MMMSVSKPPTLLALFSVLIFLSFKLSYCIVCPEIEKQSLLSFKQSLHDPLHMLSSWNGEVNCCEWEGVSCSNLTGHVHQLHLQSHYLSGKINPCLLNLKHLKYLDLSLNDFEETIPSFFGSLTSLEYLNLSDAGFHGMIPYNIGNLSNLHTLSLEDVRLLDVDSLEWLSGLSKLEHLNMNGVNLRKAADKWPEQVITKLPSLVELHFSNCSLGNIEAPPNDIVVNITHSNLVVLDLSLNFYVNIIPRWIFQLSNLVYLYLSHNSFEGAIPTFTNTTKLQHIDLSLNALHSSIPEWLYSCTHLQFVDLSDNNLEGTISHSIANLTSLNTLYLYGNELSGKIPKEIGNLCKMQTLWLSRNKLKGEILDLFGNMSDCFLGALETLRLSWNQLEGVIPNNIGNLSSLQSLYLDSNKLSGNIPESMGKLFNLEVLDISNNMLEGVVTETHFAHLSKLTSISASRNHLTLKVIPNWIPPLKLHVLELGSWNLGSGSPIPSWLHTQKKNISSLDLSCTGISGNVPSWIWSMSYLDLSHNQLQGKIPDLSGRPDFGQLIYLSSNNFSGSLPRVANNVTELDLSNNSFSGGISHFLCHTTTNETYQLKILHLGGNQLSGELPDDCWMKWSSLTVLNLGNNNFSGRIPNSIGLLRNLLSLNLYGNMFSGPIPSSVQNCTDLRKMDLSDNNLDGSIPEWIGTSLSRLWILILRSNKLSGEITPSICKLTSLQILDLKANKFSGTIPRCVNNFIAMATRRSLPEDFFSFGQLGYSQYNGAFLEGASIAIKGSEYHFDTIIRFVNSIDLSMYNLTGNIPKELTSLVELISLNLSGNHFTGLIPDGIGSLEQLESLDFSRNSLSGQIPSSLATISFLSCLNLSCNNLTGRIPEGTQLQAFDKSSFIGNNLCGPPLTISCSDDPLEPAHAEDQDQEDEIEWLYVFISLGYAVGLSGVLYTFYMKKSWMDACYELLENMWDSVYVYFYIRWRRLRRSFGLN